MLTTAIMILTMSSPLLVILGLLALAAWRDHRREAVVARQIRLTDASRTSWGRSWLRSWPSRWQARGGSRSGCPWVVRRS